jgi:hypothetical protein
VGPVLLRVDGEVPGKDARPVVGLTVGVGRHRRDPRDHVRVGDTHTLGKEGENLQDGSHVQIEKLDEIRKLPSAADTLQVITSCSALAKKREAWGRVSTLV